MVKAGEEAWGDDPRGGGPLVMNEFNHGQGWRGGLGGDDPRGAPSGG